MCPSSKDKLEFKGRKLNVLHLLGEGGFSMVFLVQDEDTLEHFALKRIYTRDRDALEVSQHLLVSISPPLRLLLFQSFACLPAVILLSTKIRPVKK